MKWALIFWHMSGLSVEYIAETEDECHRVGAKMHQIYKVAHVCAEIGVGMILDEAMIIQDTPFVTRENVRAVRRQLRSQED